jgi:hypothetical protein
MSRRETGPSPGSARVVLASVLGVCLSLSCARHVRLVVPDTSPGPRYVCRAPAHCQPAAVDDPAQANPPGTLQIALPRECQGRVNEILVVGAQSGNPEVQVTCAPVEEPIGDIP